MFLHFQTMKKVLFIAISASLFLACKPHTNESPAQDSPAPESAVENGTSIFGSYVDNSYAQRAEGYDWVGVSIRPAAQEAIRVSVRSRADKKKPTCTLDTKAYKEGEGQYIAVHEGARIRFVFAGDSLVIAAEDPASAGVLNFFCSGGATVGGTYHKLDGELDAAQVDPTSFMKVLNLQGVGFNVSSVRKGNENTLTVFTFGLKGQDYRETFAITGEQVVEAETEDLDADGSPELFVYTQSDGSGSYGNVYAFSVNNMKSMSQVYFPPIAEDLKLNQGYMGHDEFTVVETRLSRRFPIYKEGDANANPTGGTRQVTYVLKPGEAQKKLVVDKVSEY